MRKQSKQSQLLRDRGDACQITKQGLGSGRWPSSTLLLINIKGSYWGEGRQFFFTKSKLPLGRPEDTGNSWLPEVAEGVKAGEEPMPPFSQHGFQYLLIS